MNDKRRRVGASEGGGSNTFMGGQSNGYSNGPTTPDDGINPWTYKPYSQKYYKLREGRKKLPIYDARSDILEALKNNQVVVLEGETGSGKTTQVPQLLVEAGYVTKTQYICCTQPRRVAAINVARRVAEEMDVKLGEQVGYSIRWDDKTDKNLTILKYLTDGMLLREAMDTGKMADKLKDYSVIVLDEAHERTLSTDILLGLLKSILECRPDLKVIVMSATLDAHKFQEYFDGAPLLKVPGRMFEVQKIYSSAPEEDYVKAAIRTAIEIHQTQPPGDILIFLTGEEEIEDCVKKIQYGTAHLKEKGETWVLPLYSSLPPNKQQLVFKDPPQQRNGAPPTRKIICSTNVAETSLTIDGVVYVIDPGFAKQKIYNPRVRVESLLVQAISRASAKQRAGRAGRTRPGKCYRLYTEESFEQELTDTAYPEILRSNLGNVVLTLKTLGIDDLVHFDFMDPPAPETLMRALEQLNYLGALDDEGDLTEFGNHMAAFPLPPDLSACLINSQKWECSADVLSIVAMLANGSNWFMRVKKDRNCDQAKAAFDHEEGDHLTLLNVYNSYKQQNEKDAHQWCRVNYVNPRFMRNADHVRSQLFKIMKRRNFILNQAEDTSERSYLNKIKRALLSAFYQQVAFKTGRGGQYITCKDQQAVVIHPSCGMNHYPQWVFYNEFVYTKKQYIRTCSATKGDWLLELAPHYFDMDNFPAGDCKNELMSLTRKRAKRKKKLEDAAKANGSAAANGNGNADGDGTGNSAGAVGGTEVIDVDEDEVYEADPMVNSGRGGSHKKKKNGELSSKSPRKRAMNRKGRK